MESIQFSGYIVGVDRTRITIRVDEEDVDRIAAYKSYLSKHHETGNFITVNTRLTTYKINPRIQWSEIKDLIGIHAHVKIHSITLSIKKTKPTEKAESSAYNNYYHDVISHRASRITSIE